MRQPAGGADLALERLPRVGGPRQVGGQHLDRDRPVHGAVPRLIHAAHRPAADLIEDDIRAELEAVGATVELK